MHGQHCKKLEYDPEWGNGLPRLRNIHENVLATNKDSVIIDPIYVKNHGTLAEYGQQKEAQKRKNYAFYEGYSRLNVDLRLPTVVSYEGGSGSPLIPTASGLMFRISPNIQLYEANLSDTFNMFDTAFISGGPSSRRIIIPSNDSLLQKFQTDGIWLKGDSANSSEKNYYCGMEAVRLKMKSGVDSIGVPFAVGSEREVLGDVVGSIVGCGSNIMHVFALEGDTSHLDTIENAFYPNVMLHGQKRRIVYNSNIVGNDSIGYKILTDPVDRGKMSLTDKSKYGVTLVDTSTTDKQVKVLGIQYVWLNQSRYQCARVIEQVFESRKIAMKDAAMGYYYSHIDDPEIPFALAIERDTTKWLKNKDRGIGVSVSFSTGISIFDNRDTTENSRLWPTSGQVMNTGETKTRAYSVFLTWDEFYKMVLKKDSLYITFKNGGVDEYLSFGRYNGKGIIDKEELAVFNTGDLYSVKIIIPTDPDSLCYDYWIPNTANGYNNKWEVTIKKNGVLAKNVVMELGFEQGYQNYNQGATQPVFMNSNGDTISTAVTNGNGKITGYRFGFFNGTSGRVGDVYKTKVRVQGRQKWFDAEEKYYLGVYDKIMLDIAKTYCNDASIADWTGRQCKSSDPPITDAVAYSYGGKDAVDHFNADMNDWKTVMDSSLKCAAKVYDSLQRWKNEVDAHYETLFANPLTTDSLFYANMIIWRDTQYGRLNYYYNNPDPVALFNDDMIEWKGVMDSLFGVFPSAPDTGNKVLLDSLRDRLNSNFVLKFPANIQRQWNITTAIRKKWVNYRIDNNGNINTADTIIRHCYRPRLAYKELLQYFGNPLPSHPYCPSQWAGIDCSGFVQRCAAGHTSLPPLNENRFTWNGTGQWPDARNAAHMINGYTTGGVTTYYTSYIGPYGADTTYSRLVPGDLIIRDDHVTIVNFLIGERGNLNVNSINRRDASKICLIQAIGGSDKHKPSKDRLGGRVTVTWRWGNMNDPGTYHARRVLP